MAALSPFYFWRGFSYRKVVSFLKPTLYIFLMEGPFDHFEFNENASALNSTPATPSTSSTTTTHATNSDTRALPEPQLILEDLAPATHATSSDTRDGAYNSNSSTDPQRAEILLPPPDVYHPVRSRHHQPSYEDQDSDDDSTLSQRQLNARRYDPTDREEYRDEDHDTHSRRHDARRSRRTRRTAYITPPAPQQDPTDAAEIQRLKDEIDQLRRGSNQYVQECQLKDAEITRLKNEIAGLKRQEDEDQLLLELAYHQNKVFGQTLKKVSALQVKEGKLVSRIKRLKNQKANLKDELERKTVDWDDAAQRIGQAKAERDAYKDEAELYKKDLQKYEDLQKTINRLEDELLEMDNRINKLNEKIQDYEYDIGCPMTPLKKKD